MIVIEFDMKKSLSYWNAVKVHAFPRTKGQVAIVIACWLSLYIPITIVMFVNSIQLPYSRKISRTINFAVFKDFTAA